LFLNCSVDGMDEVDVFGKEVVVNERVLNSEGTEMRV
jgi:hypothetical protein